jgi:uncharacterized protein YidB (DUF937 family)
MLSSRAILRVRRLRGTLERVVRRRNKSSSSVLPETDRHEPGAAQRIEMIERRLEHLEAMVEGLQDAMHRESVREWKKLEELERKIDPAEIRRALGKDAREHGL